MSCWRSGVGIRGWTSGALLLRADTHVGHLIGSRATNSPLSLGAAWPAQPSAQPSARHAPRTTHHAPGTAPPAPRPRFTQCNRLAVPGRSLDRPSRSADWTAACVGGWRRLIGPRHGAFHCSAHPGERYDATQVSSAQGWDRSLTC